MRQEDKQLLLKDLCARLPYGVIVRIRSEHYTDSLTKKLDASHLFGIQKSVLEVKPYLRPMSNMTEEEERIYNQLMTDIHYKSRVSTANRFISWMLENHFDYQELIPKGLAIEVTKENNPYEEINL